MSFRGFGGTADWGNSCSEDINLNVIFCMKILIPLTVFLVCVGSIFIMVGKGRLSKKMRNEQFLLHRVLKP